MLFNSLDFLIFFPAVLLVYYLIPNRVRHLWLLAASYYFYMCWNARYALLILFSTAVTYASGLAIDGIRRGELPEEKKTRYKKWVVAVSFVTNLAILFFFKYMNFTVGLLSQVLGRLHIQLNLPAFDILLPVGISFYTFQALSYTMDVYRGEIYAEKDFFRYALFVSFFPQLVAGPIERSKNLLKQLAVPKAFDFERAVEGLLLMLWGFFLKIVLADRIAIFVNMVYHDFVTFSGWYLIVGTVLFAVQIYCDFAGYSTIAMGSAKILGVELMENFDAPYLSVSVAEFWRKWHISLTSWFKDYLYIPLGGSRKGKARKYLNKMIVFLLSGLWHGAQISMVSWGALNGVYQIAGEMLEPARCRLAAKLKVNREWPVIRVIRMMITFLLVDVSWIFFRVERFTDALRILRSILRARNFGILFDGSLYKLGVSAPSFRMLLAGIAVLIAADICKHRGIQLRRIILRQNIWLRAVTIAVLVLVILTFGVWGPAFDTASFIYFQF